MMRIYITTLLIIFLAGCSLKTPEEKPKEAYAYVPVLLATDRKKDPQEKQKLENIFLNERGDGSIYYAEVTVSIAMKNNKSRSSKKRSLWKKKFSNISEEEMMILDNLTLLHRKDFYHILEKRLTKYSDGDIMLYIHGYKNDIKKAILRTAQLSYDIENLSGKHFIPMTYSWPSKNQIKRYLADYEATEWSVPHLKRFLLDIHTKAKGRNINVIVHSMGSQVFTKALTELYQEKKTIRFNEVILASPDIDAKIFMDNIIPAIENSTKRTTIYMSTKDRAIMLSEGLRIREPRLGRGDDDLKPILLSEKLRENRIDFINASSIDFSLWKPNHSYYAKKLPVIRDISGLMRGMTVKQRSNKNYIKNEKNIWWDIVDD